MVNPSLRKFFLILLTVAACDVEMTTVKEETCLSYADQIIDFKPGPGAGFGMASMPDIALEPEPDANPNRGSLHVISLGAGGEIILSFSEGKQIVNKKGPDFVIFENTFWISGDSTNPYSELGEVSVSLDGKTWAYFPCDDGVMPYDENCTGWRPRLFESAEQCCFSSPSEVGGDQYYLADIGMTAIRYIRIQDLSADGTPPSAGYDLDVVGAFHIH